MKLSKRTTTIILWLVSIGLLAGMVISFTPGLSAIGGLASSRGKVEMTVNGKGIYEHEVQQARANALYASVTDGEVGSDLQRLLVDQIVRQAVLDQAAARTNVSGGDVRRAVNDFREERGVAGGRNNRAYEDLIATGGFTDSSFRAYMEEQLRLEKYQNSIVGDVTVSDAEAEAYYESHLSSYQTDERIVARQIVVADADLARELRWRAIRGEDFAELASEYSLDLADRGGAIGAASGETEPRPVGRAALPTTVANAAFSLLGAGITDVISNNERYYVISVEEFQPPTTRPYEEVADTVREAALAAKQAGVFEAELERLRGEAKVEFPSDSSLSFDNPVVATVNGVEIRATKLDTALYTNPQIQQLLSPQSADLIVGLFKPSVLGQVIDTEAAYQAADTLGVPLVGTRTGVAQAALNYIGREATADDDEVSAYYQEHISDFTVPGEAVVTQANFPDRASAFAFRSAVLAGADAADAAEANGGTLVNHGLVEAGQLQIELDAALFSTDAFEAVAGSQAEVSDVIVIAGPVDVPDEDAGADDSDAATAEADDEATSDADAASGEDAADEIDDADAADAEDAVAEDVDGADDAAPAVTDTYVVLVAERLPERVRSLDDVRAVVYEMVVGEKKQQVRSDWLDSVRKEADIEEFTAAAGIPDLPQPDIVFSPDEADGAVSGEGGEAAGEAGDEASDEAASEAADDADGAAAGDSSEGAAEDAAD